MVIDAVERFQSRSEKSIKVDALTSGYGSQARQALQAYEGLLSVEDRKRMAENFSAIISRFSLKPRHLLYTSEASSNSGLRRDLSRLSNPDSAAIPARPFKWVQYLALVSDTIRNRGDRVDDNWLYHRLTLGTQFHPVRFVNSDPEKLVTGYESLALEIDTEFSLMKTYSQIGEILAAQGRKEWTRELISELAVAVPAFSLLESDLNEYLPEALLNQVTFDGRNFLESTRDQQEIILRLVEDSDDEQRIEAAKNGEMFAPMNTLALRRYLHGVDPRLTLSEYDMPFGGFHPALADEYGLDWLPHALLGWGSLLKEADLGDVDSVKESVNAEGILCSSIEQEWDDDVGYVYLVLYPSPGMEQLVPLLMFRGGWPRLNTVYSLTGDLLTVSEGRFLPADVGRVKEANQWFGLFELLLDTKRILGSLKATAPNIVNQPLLVAEREAAEERRRSIDLLFAYDGGTSGADS